MQLAEFAFVFLQKMRRSLAKFSRKLNQAIIRSRMQKLNKLNQLFDNPFTSKNRTMFFGIPAFPVMESLAFRAGNQMLFHEDRIFAIRTNQATCWYGICVLSVAVPGAIKILHRPFEQGRSVPDQQKQSSKNNQ